MPTSLTPPPDDPDPEDEHARRTTSNLAVIAAVLLLMIGGLWLIRTMQKLEREETCLATSSVACRQIDLTR
jgi:hypothetical protein